MFKEQSVETGCVNPLYLSGGKSPEANDLMPRKHLKVLHVDS